MEEEAHLFADNSPPINSKKSYGGSRSEKKTCWCCLQVLLVIALIIFFAAAVCLGVLYGLSLSKSSTSSSSSTKDDVCTTQSCVSLASTISRNLDSSVDPCKDFYNYTCGGWVDKSVIPAGNGIWGVFEELDERNKIALKKLLEATEDSKIKAIQLTRKLYQSCMDLDQITKTGTEPLANVLMSIGGWELVDLHNGIYSN